MKLNKKILITILAPLLFSCLFLIWGTQQFMSHWATQSLIMNNRAIAQHLSDQIYQNASSFITLLSSTSQSAVFIDYLNKQAQNEHTDNTQIEQLFNKIITISPQIYSLQLTDNTGKVFAKAGQAKRSAHSGQLENSRSQSFFYIDMSQEQESFISTGLKVTANNMPKQAFYLIAQASTSKLQKDISLISNSNKLLFLLNKQSAQIVFSSNNKNYQDMSSELKNLNKISALEQPIEVTLNEQNYLAMNLQGITLGAHTYLPYILQATSQLDATLYKQLARPSAYLLLFLLLIAALLYYSLNHIIIVKISKLKQITDNIAAAKLKDVKVKDDELEHLSAQLTDIMAMQGQHHQEIQQATCYDNLTKLSNRYLFNQLLEQEVERCRRYKKRFALIYLDVNGFKKLNDNYGHSFGDQVLIKFSQILQQQVRDSDVIGRWEEENNVARLAGDEFAILLTELKDGFPALRVAKRILETLEQAINIDGQQIRLHTNIGITHYPEDADKAEILLKNADAAMYQAKSIGRNQFKLFSKELSQRINRQEALYNALQFALANDEFELHFQPYISANSETIAGAEALLRWSSHKLGPVSPAEFIPVAEHYGLVTEIDRWVMRNAMKVLSELKLAEKEIKISINISNSHFHNRFFPEFMVNCMEDYNIGPEQFELEITETAMTDLDEQFLEVANAISAIGVSLVLDDFGTGFTSLSHLSCLPITKIKIDRSHVIEISKQTDGIRLVDVLLSISESYKLKITAEGVEEHAQKDYLANKRCDFLQGYLFYKPMPKDDFAHAIKENLKSKSSRKKGE